MLTTAVAGLLTQLPLLAAPIELATCTSADSLKSWTSVNDGVMGGISTGGFKRTEQGTLLFSGVLSLENNGGFASVRSPALRQDLAGLEAFVLRVRGDGRRYKFTVRTESGFDTPIYQASFATKRGEREEHRLAFKDFVPPFRGRVLTDVPPLKPAGIASVGLRISDKQAGPFELEVAWIKAAPASGE
jgi:monofunctional biosynthetic peptidoglycan transglycosylase